MYAFCVCVSLCNFLYVFIVLGLFLLCFISCSCRIDKENQNWKTLVFWFGSLNFLWNSKLQLFFQASSFFLASSFSNCFFFSASFLFQDFPLEFMRKKFICLEWKNFCVAVFNFGASENLFESFFMFHFA